MSHLVQTWVDEYYKWLKDNTDIYQLPTGWIEIATPFLDRHNDGLVIYVNYKNGIITLSDDSYIINDLEMCGSPISTKSRQKMLMSFLQKYGITLDGKEMTLKTSPENFPQKKHMFIQAMLAVNDMFMLGRKHTKNIFLDDLAAFFDEKDIVCMPDVQIQGISGFTHKVDFIIPGSKKKPERFIYAINSPTKDNSKLTLFNWEDIQKSRKKPSKLIVFINDAKPISKDILVAFTAYETTAVPWSKRDNFISELSIA